MTWQSPDTPEPATRHYGVPGYPVVISGDQIQSTVRTWYRFGKRLTVTQLSDYTAVGHRIVARTSWFQRYPDQYRQAVLVHRDNRFKNIALDETRISLFESDVAFYQLRAMLEKFGKELALPVIDSDRPPRLARPRMNATPGQVFETRLPDELDWSVRDLVAHGRLVVSRNLPPPPRGLAIRRQGGTRQVTFNSSALWETLRIIGYLFVLIGLGMAYSRHNYSSSVETRLSGFLLGSGVITAFAFLVIFPIKYFLNGNELLLAEDRWTYKPASGSLLSPSVQVMSQLRISEIEEIYRSRRDVVIGSDREYVALRCRSRAMAKWMEQALLAVAAYGLAVLDDCVPERGGTDAGAPNAPASHTR